MKTFATNDMHQVQLLLMSKLVRVTDRHRCCAPVSCQTFSQEIPALRRPLLTGKRARKPNQALISWPRSHILIDVLQNNYCGEMIQQITWIFILIDPNNVATWRIKSVLWSMKTDTNASLISPVTRLVSFKHAAVSGFESAKVH